jgi:DNA-binding response OmpR family regulator
MNGPCCPTCYRPFETAIEWNAESGVLRHGADRVELSKRQAMLFDAIWRAKDGLRNRERLVLAGWADDPDGGPEGRSTLSAHINHIRERIRPLGLTITSRSASPSSSWRVQLLSQPAAVKA